MPHPGTGKYEARTLYRNTSIHVLLEKLENHVLPSSGVLMQSHLVPSSRLYVGLKCARLRK